MAANVPTMEEAQEKICAESNITGTLNGRQGHVSAKKVNNGVGSTKTSKHSTRL